MAELTPYGFEREDYQTLLNKTKERFRAEFGVGIALDDENIAGQFAALLSKVQNDIHKLLESAISTQTLSGAEGIYLDDMFSRAGIFRRGKQAGTGEAVVEVNSLTPNNYSLLDTTKFKASNGKEYQPEADVLITTVVTGFKLSVSDLATNTEYTISIKNTTTGADEIYTLVSGEDDTAKLDFLNVLLSLVLGATTENSQICYISGNTLYLGFENVNNTLVGLAETTEFQLSPTAGLKYCAIPVICNDLGYFPVAAGEIKQISPSFTGFVSVTNIIPFYAGSEVETDSEYRTRYFTEIAAKAKTNRDGIASAILGLDGVTKVRIYDNPTALGQIEADPFTFNTVVLGGTTADISQAIYDSKPINTSTSGTTSLTVNTLDGDVETIRHTKAVQVGIDLRIKYRTINRVPLSSIERQAILVTMTDYFTGLNIGDIIYNTKLVFNVLSSTGSSRISSVEVMVKRSSQSATLFAVQNLEPAFDELPVLNQAGVEFSLQL